MGDALQINSGSIPVAREYLPGSNVITNWDKMKYISTEVESDHQLKAIMNNIKILNIDEDMSYLKSNDEQYYNYIMKYLIQNRRNVIEALGVIENKYYDNTEGFHTWDVLQSKIIRRVVKMVKGNLLISEIQSVDRNIQLLEKTKLSKSDIKQEINKLARKMNNRDSDISRPRIEERIELYENILLNIDTGDYLESKNKILKDLKKIRDILKDEQERYISNEIATYQLIPGQRIAKHGAFDKEGLYHFAIYVGHGFIYHFGGRAGIGGGFGPAEKDFKDKTDQTKIPFFMAAKKLDALDTFYLNSARTKSPIYIFENLGDMGDKNASVINKRLDRLIEQSTDPYMMQTMINNCESVANYISYGKFESAQANKFIKTPIKVVFVAHTPLGIRQVKRLTGWFGNSGERGNGQWCPCSYGFNKLNPFAGPKRCKVDPNNCPSWTTFGPKLGSRYTRHGSYKLNVRDSYVRFNTKKKKQSRYSVQDSYVRFNTEKMKQPRYSWVLDE